MNIVVCPLSQVHLMVAAHRPERVISLIDPEFEFPELGPTYREHHLRLHFHDVCASANGVVAPTAAHVRQILEFVSGWSGAGAILIHCHAGISRSSAAAFMAACFHSPVPELAIAQAMRSFSPIVRPNELLIRLADAAMDRRGRMIEAIRDSACNVSWEAVGENSPFELSLSGFMPVDDHPSAGANSRQRSLEATSQIQ